jgi:hypothetical protein
MAPYEPNHELAKILSGNCFLSYKLANALCFAISVRLVISLSDNEALFFLIVF